MKISDKVSTGKNYAVVENGEVVVVVVLNEETRRKGYMPISEAKEFVYSIIDAYKNAIPNEHGTK